MSNIKTQHAMRRFIFIPIAMLFMLPSFAQEAKEESVPKKKEDNRVQKRPRNLTNFFVNPIYLIEGTFMIGYEFYKPERHIGVVLSGGPTLVDNNKELQKGIRAELRINHYLNDLRNPKFYIAPYITYRYVEIQEGVDLNLDLTGNGSETSEVPTDHISSYGLGVALGLKTIYLKRGTIETLIGGGIQYSDIRGDSSKYGEKALGTRLQRRTSEIWFPVGIVLLAPIV